MFFQFYFPQSMPLEDVLAELRSLQAKMGLYMSQEGRSEKNTTEIGVKLSFRSDLDKRGKDDTLTFEEIEELEKLLRMLVARWIINLCF